MFFSNHYLFYITIVLQAICVIHCLKKGNDRRWILAIVFLPLMGCIAYVFSEMFTGRDIKNVQEGVGAVFNPSGRIKKLEDNLRFSDTFNNKVALADAYLGVGQTTKAIALYESSLTGNFTENEYVLRQLIIAFSIAKRYADVVPLAQKIYRLPQFPRSKEHILYAIALEHTGKPEQAEVEFKMMKARYSNFESRFQYGQFLIRANRTEEARQLYAEILGEFSHLGSVEKRTSAVWFAKTKEELRKMKEKNMAG